MPEIIGVKFDFNPKVYYFSPNGLQPETGCGVVVETSAGLNYGTVVMPVQEMDNKKIVGKLMPVVRIATQEDVEKHAKLLAKRDEAMPQIAQKIRESGLEMKLVGAEYTFEGGKLVVYFTADGRVDFRNLVRELASAFHTRIELKQIGARDECRMMGGIAPCGRACCCSDHMPEYARVSIKMAKTQNLSLNPTKISGLCGRLMCCLAYENEYYAEANKELPKVGSAVTTAAGESGTVTGVNQLKKTVRLKIENKDKDTVRIEDFAVKDIRFKPRNAAPQKDDAKDDPAEESDALPPENNDNE
ncbi:MAG: stage 0 sporulation family protein [Clostridiales bacterium]|nr:stage 0 sporulation family protein [Clostridiales bacterium]